MVFKQQRIVWKLKNNGINESSDRLSAPVAGANISQLPIDDSEKKATPDIRNYQAADLKSLQSSEAEKPKSEVLKTNLSVNVSHFSDETQVSRSKAFFNPNLKEPMVDGERISVTPNITEKSNWRNLPYRLRRQRADVFVDMHSGVDYLQSLLNFLQSKQLDVKPYDDTVHYLPSDILLVDETTLVDAGTLLVLQKGKRYIWEQLKKEFGQRLQ